MTPEWIVTEDGEPSYLTVVAPTADEALALAIEGVARENYPDAAGTLWVDVRVRCGATGESTRATVTLDEPEPPCGVEPDDTGESVEDMHRIARGELSPQGHDWQSPIDLVGGIAENPGVWGHGGGVIATEVCMRCGCKRTTDTWATRPDTGEQGLTSVRHEPGYYRVPSMRLQAAQKALRCAEGARAAVAVICAHLGQPDDDPGEVHPRAAAVALYLEQVTWKLFCHPRASAVRGCRLALFWACNRAREDGYGEVADYVAARCLPRPPSKRPSRPSKDTE